MIISLQIISINLYLCMCTCRNLTFLVCVCAYLSYCLPLLMESSPSCLVVWSRSFFISFLFFFWKIFYPLIFIHFPNNHIWKYVLLYACQILPLPECKKLPFNYQTANKLLAHPMVSHLLQMKYRNVQKKVHSELGQATQNPEVILLTALQFYQYVNRL